MNIKYIIGVIFVVFVFILFVYNTMKAVKNKKFNTKKFIVGFGSVLFTIPIVMILQPIIVWIAIVGIILFGISQVV